MGKQKFEIHIEDIKKNRGFDVLDDRITTVKADLIAMKDFFLE